MGTTNLLISSTLFEKGKKLAHLEREFQKARLELDEKRCLVGKKTAALHPDAGRRVCDGSFLLTRAGG
ncbi:MAG: hypothetical protein ACLT8V_02575 [Streptococcus salivarius]